MSIDGEELTQSVETIRVYEVDNNVNLNIDSYQTACGVAELITRIAELEAMVSHLNGPYYRKEQARIAELEASNRIWEALNETKDQKIAELEDALNGAHAEIDGLIELAAGEDI